MHAKYHLNSYNVGQKAIFACTLLCDRFAKYRYHLAVIMEENSRSDFLVFFVIGCRQRSIVSNQHNSSVIVVSDNMCSNARFEFSQMFVMNMFLKMNVLDFPHVRCRRRCG